MRTGLIAFGVIFIVLGVVLYYFPNPSAGASATTISDQGTVSRTSFASVIVPIQLVLASLIIGALLLVLGLIIPNPYGASFVREDRSGKINRVDDEVEDADNHTTKNHLVHTKEEEIRGRHGRKVIRERREHHRTA